jgi:hypothetical protein
MGGGSWSQADYKNRTQTKIDSGQSFAYTRQVKASGVYAVHADLDPKTKAGDASPYAGQVMRECRDNAEHPNSLPIAVFYDETGSMGNIPVVVQKKLAGLFSLLLRKGYAEDPQILVGAYGDAKSDRVPLQVSQFESDNRIDENLDNIFIESNGGGNGGESASLAWYYLANHTSADAWEKRGKKGYAFFIADEISHELTADKVVTFVGEEPIGDISNAALAKKLQEKYEVYMLVIDNSSASMQGSEKFYTKLFGAKHVLMVEDPESIAETIALTIGVMEGTVDFDDAADDLADAGSNAVAILSATKAVAPLRNLAGAGVLAKGDAAFDTNTASGSARL